MFGIVFDQELAACRKRQLNQGSFVSAVCLVVCFLWFVLCLCV